MRTRNASLATRLALLVTALGLTGGCVDATIEQYREADASSIRTGERIVILGRRHNNGYETETGFVDCIGDDLSRGDAGVEVVPEPQFVDALFPGSNRAPPRSIPGTCPSCCPIPRSRSGSRSGTCAISSGWTAPPTPPIRPGP
ncbi:MAG: hypothetical protein U5R48_08125 [Gammaproteobacteria bacterium]|nr:hypothetical protein [Gammaproteobacteria bacterium]